MRAPLGMKTTNAKAAAFATPAPQTEPGSEKTGAKSSGPRLRRAKVKVHQASPAVEIAQDEERDIEYMPPPEIRMRPIAMHSISPTFTDVALQRSPMIPKTGHRT